jgi:hypothetical protein
MLCSGLHDRMQLLSHDSLSVNRHHDASALRQSHHRACTRNECPGHCGWTTPGRGRKLMQQCELVQMYGVAVLQQFIVEFWTVQVAIYSWSSCIAVSELYLERTAGKKTRLLATHQKRHAKQVPRQFFAFYGAVGSHNWRLAASGSALAVSAQHCKDWVQPHTPSSKFI